MGFKNVITLVILLGAVALMIKLGIWQLHRLEWKQAILADIEAQDNINPMTHPLDLQKDTPNFATGYIDGALNDNIVLIAPRTRDGEVGRDVYTVIKTDTGTNVAVNLGWVAANETPHWAGLAPNRFAGYLRTPDQPNSFIPSNMSSENQWYIYNADDFKRYYNLDSIFDKVLYASMQLPSSNIEPFEGLPRPRNKHAQYAAFWFTMAGVLVFLSGFYIWRQRKK
tara:strand:- start:2292 stop:2966 length:675 start_codon:yes stop_codon:yes gene_type:complete